MSSASEILGESGPIATALGDAFEPRAEQLRMAERVARAFQSRSHLLVEAGTGVGKSFAYLAPAMLRCVDHGETIVVATNTIALQEQLIDKDVPLLAAAIGGRDRAAPGGAAEGQAPGRDLKPVLVKGRGNYVSIRRLKLASSRQDRLFADAASRRSLHLVEDWAYDTPDGSLSTLPQLERPGVWDRVQSDSGNCMGRRCPHHGSCFYQAARREMEAANLLVCNHALFFSDLALRVRGAGFLPRYDHVVFDEAHGAEDVAAEHFGVGVSEGQVQHLLSNLHHARTGRGYLGQLQLAGGDVGPVERAIALVGAAAAASGVFFESLVRLSESDEVTNGRVRRAGAVDNVLTPAFNDLAIRLRGLRDVVKVDADRFELNAYADRASAIADAAEVLVEQTASGCCYWIEVTRPGSGGRRGPVRVKLACSPIDVAPLLKEHLFGKEHGVVLTSATLATRTVGDDEPTEVAETAFAHAMARLGCEGAETLQLGSPFDYAEQVEVFVDATMPSPTFARGAGPGSGVSYERALVERILDHLAATEGGAFVLFTSFRTLYDVADRLEGPLASLEMPMLVQGRGGSRSQILEAFRHDPRSVLLGAASFWQGVDVRGEALRNVIITRLPFDPPDRPLTEARLERIRDRGGDPFREDSLPRAVIRFKQGFGRLIRSRADRGRVVILDPRVVKTGYGRAFLQALPEGVALTRL